jgi:hypothetical protein
MERMAKHPRVGGYGEVLLPGVEGWSNWPRGAADRPFFTSFLKERGLADSHLNRHRQLFTYLDYLLEPRRDFRAIGFKLMYNHLARYPEVLPYMTLRRVTVLHLIRTNLLDLFLSREAVKSRRWQNARAPGELELIRVHVDTNDMLRQLPRIEREQRVARAVLRAWRLKVHELTYEQLLADDSALHGALGRLGINGSATLDLSPIMLKMAPTSHREGIANFDDVARALDGTRYMHFLRSQP